MKIEHVAMYVNDLDLQEVLSNRKYVMNYIKQDIDYLKNIVNTKLWKPEYATRLETMEELYKLFKLRR